MRIDKFLKVSRIIKRRTLAKEVTEANRIFVNDKLVKPSYQVKPNDLITIEFGNKSVTIKVLSIAESTKKEDASKMYELVKEEKKESNRNPS